MGHVGYKTQESEKCTAARKGPLGNTVYPKISVHLMITA
jgi:hypothetical protein